MGRLPFTLSFLALIVAASVAALSCGASSQSQLQSITVNPAVADAQDYPNGEVPFTATGFYVNPPHSAPISTNWVACQQNVPTSEVSISTAGVAQCASGATGSYAVISWVYNTGPGVYSCPAAITACGGGCTIVGTAQLTCP